MDLTNYKEISPKKMQELQLEVLIDIDKICKKHNIKYNLMFGTLLGAIRHKGFIPWDYDIDICLLRKEYDRLIEVLMADEKFNTKYFVLNSKTDNKYYLPMSKIIIKDSKFINEDGYYPSYTFGIHIDLFPFEVQKLTEVEAEKRYKKKNKLLTNANRKYGDPISRNKFRHFAKSIYRKISFWLTPKKIAKKLDKMCKNDEVELKNALIGNYNDLGKFMPGEWFSESIEVPFEGHMFSVPKDYDKVLKLLYNDYMQLPDESKRSCDVKGYIKVEQKK